MIKNNGELIAESVAEYMDGNPRETAKKVIDKAIKNFICKKELFIYEKT